MSVARKDDVTKGSVIGWWLLTRAAMLAYWMLVQPAYLAGDVTYYHRQLSAMADVGLAHSLVEYPTPVVAILAVPWLIGWGTLWVYVAGFVTLMLALDVVFTAWLYRRGEDASVRYWLWALPLMGSLVYLRFDLVPAFCAGAALLEVRRRRATAGGLVGVGAATKLWPALLIPALWSRDKLRATVGMLGTGAALAVVSLVVGGWDRLVSPLTWQSDRGLQVESVWATWPMLDRLIGADHTVFFSPFNAYEVAGPSVDALLTTSSVATVVGIAAIVALSWAAWRHPGFDQHTAALMVLAITLIMIVTNKAFSPQYMLWLLAPAAVLQARGATAQHRWVGVVILALSAATQLIYPMLYTSLAPDLAPGIVGWIATMTLAIRNLGILVAAGWLWWLAWTSLTRTTENNTTALLV